MGRKKTHRARMYRLVGEPPPGAIAAGYVRYSSDMQHAATIVTQKRRIQELADAKGWVLRSWFEEPAQSAKFEDIAHRPQFARLLREAGSQFTVVLCFSTSRWSRNVAVTHLSLAELRRKGVWWATADEPWTIDQIIEPGHSLSFGLTAQQEADFVVQLSKRVIAGKEDRARDGYHNAKVPFGYLPPEYPKAPDGAPSTWRPPRMPARLDPVNFPALVRIGELAVQGWADQAIADELVQHASTTARFGTRPLTKDTVAAIRRSWFPREFAPGSGKGTIETPAGELVEGRHPAAWPYELWQRLIETKRGQYHRPTVAVQRRAHEFSRIIVCSACRRPLRVSPSKGVAYYKDTSQVRRLPCRAFGCLSVRSSLVTRQFGEVLQRITLPAQWREAVAQRCQQLAQDNGAERLQARRAELEAEQKRLVSAFTKGYLAEAELDAQVERLRAELVSLPVPVVRDATTCTQAVISAGETLADMASYWEEAAPEDRRDIVWALLRLEGVVYDLERQLIVGLLPRPDVLPVLELGLADDWEVCEDGLWLREACRAQYAVRTLEPISGQTPPFRAHKLAPTEREAAVALVRAGQSPQQVATQFGVSYWVILRLMKHGAPQQLPHQQQPKLSSDQQQEVRRLLAQGWGMRRVAAHFGVSHSAVWRVAQHDGNRAGEGGEG